MTMPAASNALRHLAVIRNYLDPRDYPNYVASIPTAKYFAVPTWNEILGLINGSLAGFNWRHQFTAAASTLAVNDPVYLDSANTLKKAKSDTISHAQIIGFVSTVIPVASSPDNIYIDQFLRIAFTDGGTVATVYLTDAGGFSFTPGTLKISVGYSTGTGYAILFASPTPTNPNKPLRGILYDSIAQSIPTSAATQATFDTTIEDNNSFATTPNQLTIGLAGLYQLQFSGNWDLNATGYRALQIVLGSGPLNDALHVFDPSPVALPAHYQSVTAIRTLAAADTVKGSVTQSSGGALNFNFGRLTAVRLGD